jgi:hypothetical protein
MIAMFQTPIFRALHQRQKAKAFQPCANCGTVNTFRTVAFVLLGEAVPRTIDKERKPSREPYKYKE